MPKFQDLIFAGFDTPQAAGFGGKANTAVALGAGTTQANATRLPASMNIVTGADGTKAAVLDPARVGEDILVFNSSASALPVFPPVGGAIAVSGTGLGSANTAYSVAAQTLVTFRALSATQWVATKSA